MIKPPPSYVTQPEGGLRPPPYHHRTGPMYARPKKSRNWCLRFICCCYCFLFILIVVLAGLSLYFYTLYKPKIPSYKVDSVHIKTFEPQKDFSLKTEFVVYVEANNPNSQISLIYGEGSKVVLWYKDYNISTGKLPAFRQGIRNITLMPIDMVGKSKYESGLQQALTEDQKKGRVPLHVEVQAPITVVVGNLKLREFVVYVNCSLVLDSLSPNKKPKIISSTYDIQGTL